MHRSDTPLCCCEYFNINQERSHILACCCNCQDLDESFENLITGKPIPRRNQDGMLATLQDRLRVPWRGGARQVTLDAILPVLLVPVSLLCGAFNVYATITTALVECMIVFYIYHKLPKSKFFLNWVLITLIVQYLVFQSVVVPLLEILYEENVALGVLIAISVCCACMVKHKSNRLQDVQNGFLKTESGRYFHCSICQIAVPDWDHHNVWLNTCVGQHNQCYFLVALLSSIAALLYSSNLTLTSVCHPFTFYKTILLPDDCSDVYIQYELALAFVSALYSLVLGVFLLLTLLHQMLLVTLGISTQEWRNYSLFNKMCCICAKRPYSRGFLQNWCRILCFTRREY